MNEIKKINTINTEYNVMVVVLFSKCKKAKTITVSRISHLPSMIILNVHDSDIQRKIFSTTFKKGDEVIISYNIDYVIPNVISAQNICAFSCITLDKCE